MQRRIKLLRSGSAAIATAVFAAVITVGCGHPRRSGTPAPVPPPTVEDTVRVRTLPTPDDFDALLRLPDGQLDPIWAALLAETLHEPELNPRDSLVVADRLAASIAPYLGEADILENKARQVSAFVFGVARFRCQAGEGLLSPSGSPHSVREMIEQREGNCFSLSLLYVGVCRRLRIPARVSLVPYHAFVSLDDGVSQVHVETTAGGRVVDIRKFLAPLGLGDARIRTLGDRSTLAAIWQQMGLKRANQTRMAEVLDGAERALAIDPNLAEAWGQCGMIALLRGDLPRAELCLSKAIGLEPTYPWFWFARGAVYAEEGRADEAAAMYTRGLQKPIRIPAIWDNGGGFLYRRGQYPPAVRCFDRALKLEPGRTRSLEGRGLALAALGEYAAAERALRHAISREPGNQRFEDELARVLEAAKGRLRPPREATPKKP